MNHPFKRAYGKLVFALAFAVAGLSAAWFWRQQGSIRALRTEVTTPFLAKAEYVAANWRPPGPTGAEWIAPPPQSKGRGWLYEVFTPPVIYFQAGAGSFAVTPPSLVAETDGGAAGLELLAVRLQPYRLQLLGYFGEPGDYLVVFVSPFSSETLLARPGHRFNELGLTLKSFDLQKVTVGGNDAGPVWEVAALAVLQDEATDTEVVLDSRMRRFTETLLAVFKVPGIAGKPRELLEGDSFAAGGATYHIARIQLDPPEVVVARTASGLPGPEIQLLRPTAQVAGKAIPPQPPVPKAATDVARNEQEFPSP